LVRHLILPGGLAGTREVMRWLAQEISTNTYVNLMFQYRPCGKAFEVPELARRPSQKEFSMALQAAKEEGITRLDAPRSR
jgi:putative pyruvate formate lyase activating enzyme